MLIDPLAEWCQVNVRAEPVKDRHSAIADRSIVNQRAELSLANERRSIIRLAAIDVVGAGAQRR